MTFMNILFMVTCYPIILIMYLLLRNAKDRNGFCFGATLSKELKNDPAVEEIDIEYRKKLKNSMILLAIIPIAAFFIPYISLVFSLWMYWILAVCFYPMVLFAKANKQVRELKEERGWEQVSEVSYTDLKFVTDDDRNWPYGMMYYNPKDTHVMVENRMGTGTAMNMATGVGKGMYIFAALCLLIIPISSIWLIMLDFTPIQTAVVDEKIVCTHLSVEYEIPLEDIEEYTVITELPEMTKVNGNGMDHVFSGTFEIYREGMFETFLNPQNDLFIKIETEDETYYISGVDDEQTQEIVDKLAEEDI